MVIRRINDRDNRHTRATNPWVGSAILSWAICALCSTVMKITNKQYRISGRLVK